MRGGRARGAGEAGRGEAGEAGRARGRAVGPIDARRAMLRGSGARPAMRGGRARRAVPPKGVGGAPAKSPAPSVAKGGDVRSSIAVERPPGAESLVDSGPGHGKIA